MELIVLRLVHVLGGILWVGAAVFNMLFLAPALRQLGGPAAGPVMAVLRKRGLFVFLPVVALLTILSGTRLMMIMSGGFQPAWFQSTHGAVYAWSGLLSIVSFVLGVTVTRPLGNKLGRLGAELAQAPDDAARAALAAELASTQRWMATTGFALTLMLLISAAGMAVARYLV